MSLPRTEQTEGNLCFIGHAGGCKLVCSAPGALMSNSSHWLIKSKQLRRHVPRTLLSPWVLISLFRRSAQQFYNTLTWSKNNLRGIRWWSSRGLSFFRLPNFEDFQWIFINLENNIIWSLFSTQVWSRFEQHYFLSRAPSEWTIFELAQTFFILSSL